MAEQASESTATTTEAFVPPDKFASFRLPLDMAVQLMRLSELTSLKPIAIIKRGIALMAIGIKAQEQGYELAVVDKDGNVVADITGVTDINGRDTLTDPRRFRWAQAAHKPSAATERPPLPLRIKTQEDAGVESTKNK